MRSSSSRQSLRSGTAVASGAVAALLLWFAIFAAVGAAAAPLQRVEFDSASQALVPGDRIQAFMARPEGAGPFPVVVVLHGCAGMLETTKQTLADDFVAWGYAVFLVDSFGARGIDHICVPDLVNSLRRVSDAYGALNFLASQTFADPQRIAVVGFSQGAWVSLSVADSGYLMKLFAVPAQLKFRTAIAISPPCRAVAARPGIPTLVLIGALDDWTPAIDCSEKINAWRDQGAPVEQVVYPGAYHGFYYQDLQPGRTMFDHWLEYHREAAGNARLRMRQFLDRHLQRRPK